MPIPEHEPDATDHDRGSTAMGRDRGFARCVRCGSEFTCAMGARDGSCWCTAYPNVMPVPRKEAGCYCRACLVELAADRAQPG